MPLQPILSNKKRQAKCVSESFREACFQDIKALLTLYLGTFNLTYLHTCAKFCTWLI